MNLKGELFLALVFSLSPFFALTRVARAVFVLVSKLNDCISLRALKFIFGAGSLSLSLSPCEVQLQQKVSNGRKREEQLSYEASLSSCQVAVTFFLSSSFVKVQQSTKYISFGSIFNLQFVAMCFTNCILLCVTCFHCQLLSSSWYCLLLYK